MNARVFPSFSGLNLDWFQSYVKLMSFANFRPNYYFREENNKYIIKTANRFWEFFQLFRLRYHAFKSKGIFTRLSHLDIDEYDFSCDHIVIICKETNHVVGTYRVRPSTFTDDFYSQSEFSLDEFLLRKGGKLELGRACIDPSYRDGAVIDILWRGIGKYSKLCHAKYLFGCSSVKTLDPLEAGKYYHYLKNNDSLIEEENIAPLSKFKKEIPFLTSVETGDLSRELPPLLRVYLKAGAKVYGAPAFDEDFECIDFLTIIDVDKLEPQFARRYFNKNV